MSQHNRQFIKKRVTGHCTKTPLFLRGDHEFPVWDQNKQTKKLLHVLCEQFQEPITNNLQRQRENGERPTWREGDVTLKNDISSPNVPQ